jgi:hypothetical protein
MPPRKTLFTQDNIDNQLQQIHLLDPSSSTENLEQLGPIIKQIHTSRQQEAFLKTLQTLVESKEAEIEKICADNYMDFVSSVGTLLTVRSYTLNLRDKILELDSSVSSVGHGLAGKKKALLKSKQTAANLDDAIDILQSCLRVLDLVHRVGVLVKDGKYWSALRVSLVFEMFSLNNCSMPVIGRYSNPSPVILITNSFLYSFTLFLALSPKSN